MIDDIRPDTISNIVPHHMHPVVKNGEISNIGSRAGILTAL